MMQKLRMIAWGVRAGSGADSPRVGCCGKGDTDIRQVWSSARDGLSLHVFDPALVTSQGRGDPRGASGTLITQARPNPV
jgi:hypothetical protein